jgi:hypothetical protein
LNIKDLNVEYINRTYKPVGALTAVIDIFDINSKSVFHRSEQVDLGAPEAKEGAPVADFIRGNKGVSFVVLKLSEKSGKIISRNCYWISPSEDYTSLNSMQGASVNVVVSGTKQLKNETEWSFTVSNPAAGIAFFINPQLMIGEKEIAPSFWSTNYFTLAPGESINIRVGFPTEVVKAGQPYLKIGGWNVEEITVNINEAIR